jgi:hypothetical protein
MDRQMLSMFLLCGRTNKWIIFCHGRSAQLNYRYDGVLGIVVDCQLCVYTDRKRLGDAL